MPRVLTNTVSLAYSREVDLNTASGVWNTLEPNDIQTFGAELSTTARNPISKNRQRLKGLVTDLDSSVEISSDLTMSVFRDFIAGFCFATGINSDVTQIKSTAAATAANTYAVTSITASQSPKLEVSVLLWVTGGVYKENNGLKIIKTDVQTGVATIAVLENLTNETADFRVSFTGYRTSSTWTWDAVLSRATLLASGVGTRLSALGLTPGAVIHIGSIVSPGDIDIINGFTRAAASDMVGYARCIALTASAVVFDRVDPALQFTDSSAQSVDILFGEFFRNVPTDDSEFFEQSFQFELNYPNLGDSDTNRYQYSKGNFCNSMTFNLAMSDKAEIAHGFIGTDTENPVETRKPGADSPIPPTQIKAFNTSSDVARLRVLDVDGDGITTDFKSLSLKINNNVSPEKVIGLLGAKYLNTGNFEVDIEAQLLFTDSAVVNKIRCSETVSMDFIFRNDDGTISVDIPAMTIGGGGVDYPINASVLINTKSLAYIDPVTKTSIGVSIFPLPLPNAGTCGFVE